VILDWLYPKKCVGCGEMGKYFCDECLRQLVIEDGAVCPECNRLSVGGAVHRGCVRKWSMEGLVSWWQFSKIVRLGIHEWKYRWLKDAEKEFQALWQKTVQWRWRSDEVSKWKIFLKQKPVVVAVPLYWRRENWRGFNQAEVIAKWVSQQWGLEEVKDWLRRERAAGFQAGLSKQERQKNVLQVFKASGGGLQVKRVLLIDDVWTTGATMRACSKVLKKAGVNKVWGMTLAR